MSCRPLRKKFDLNVKKSSFSAKSNKRDTELFMIRMCIKMRPPISTLEAFTLIAAVRTAFSPRYKLHCKCKQNHLWNLGFVNSTRAKARYFCQERNHRSAFFFAPRRRYTTYKGFGASRFAFGPLIFNIVFGCVFSVTRRSRSDVAEWVSNR